MRRALAIAVAMAALLTGCGLFLPPMDANGIRAVWVVVPAGSLGELGGRMLPGPGYCILHIDERFVQDAHIIAHEYGHCVDYYILGWSHGNVDTRDCATRWWWDSSYYCSRSEYYAQAWADAWLNLHPHEAVRMPPQAPLPDPRAVR